MDGLTGPLCWCSQTHRKSLGNLKVCWSLFLGPTSWVAVPPTPALLLWAHRACAGSMCRGCFASDSAKHDSSCQSQRGRPGVKQQTSLEDQYLPSPHPGPAPPYSSPVWIPPRPKAAGAGPPFTEHLGEAVGSWVLSKATAGASGQNNVQAKHPRSSASGRLTGWNPGAQCIARPQPTACPGGLLLFEGGGLTPFQQGPVWACSEWSPITQTPFCPNPTLPSSNGFP